MLFVIIIEQTYHLAVRHCRGVAAAPAAGAGLAAGAARGAGPPPAGAGPPAAGAGPWAAGPGPARGARRARAGTWAPPRTTGPIAARMHLIVT